MRGRPDVRGSREVGKRLGDWLAWARSVEDPRAVGEAELSRLRQEAIDEDLEAPDAELLRETWTRQGWPGEPCVLHEQLIRYERYAQQLGDAWVASAEGPVILWPRRWGSWSLARHRALLRAHSDAVSDTEAVEAWYRSLAAGKGPGQ